MNPITVPKPKMKPIGVLGAPESELLRHEIVARLYGHVIRQRATDLRKCRGNLDSRLDLQQAHVNAAEMSLREPGGVKYAR